MKKYFLTGLIILMPIVITIAILTFIVDALTKPFIGIVSNFLVTHQIARYGFWVFSSKQVVLYGSKVIVLLGLILFTIALGFITRWLFFHSFLRLLDYLLHKIPFVNTIYKTSQEVIKTVFSSDRTAFRKVVMVPFPKKGIYVIGLISGNAPKICSKAAKTDLISVFVPTTPNPTTGFLLMYKKKELIDVDMTPEEAIKLIVSCGVMHPEKRQESSIGARVK